MLLISALYWMYSARMYVSNPSVGLTNPHLRLLVVFAPVHHWIIGLWLMNQLWPKPRHAFYYVVHIFNLRVIKHHKQGMLFCFCSLWEQDKWIPGLSTVSFFKVAHSSDFNICYIKRRNCWEAVSFLLTDKELLDNLLTNHISVLAKKVAYMLT